MNGNIKILICVFSLHALCVYSEVIEIEPEVGDYDGDTDDAGFRYNSNHDRQVKSTHHQSVNRYFCTLDTVIEGSHLIVYGSKGWTFPAQDVNLTLRYPPVDVTSSFESHQEDYIITGFEVILHIDGLQSKGYIIDGGVLQDNIALSFESREITSLRYQFWLYGVRNDSKVVELNGYYRIC